jgi:hypothetical protein
MLLEQASRLNWKNSQKNVSCWSTMGLAMNSAPKNAVFCVTRRNRRSATVIQQIEIYPFAVLNDFLLQRLNIRTVSLAAVSWTLRHQLHKLLS